MVVEGFMDDDLVQKSPEWGKGGNEAWEHSLQGGCFKEKDQQTHECWGQSVLRPKKKTFESFGYFLVQIYLLDSSYLSIR